MDFTIAKGTVIHFKDPEQKMCIKHENLFMKSWERDQ